MMTNMQIMPFKMCIMAKIQAVLANSLPNLLTHSDLFTTFASTLAKDAPFGAGRPSPEASPFGGAFVIIAPLK